MSRHPDRTNEALLTHIWFLESMESINRAIREAASLENMMTDVLDEVLSIFACDRAWLLFPCDPEAPCWRVPLERCRPEWPGVGALGQDMPMTPEGAEVVRTVLRSGAPTPFYGTFGHRIPRAAAQDQSVKSQLLTPLQPKHGEQWIFGIHQCTHERVWSEQQEALFKEISHRIEDGLSSLTLLRGLQESEELNRAVIEHSPVGVSVRDRFGKLLSFNPSWRTIWNVSEASLADYLSRERTNLELDERDDYLGEWRDDVRRIYQEGGVFRVPQLRLKHRGARGPRWVSQLFYAIKDSEGAVDRVVVLTVDISDRVSTERALRQSETRLTEAQRIAHVGDWLHDLSAGKIIWSEEMFRIAGRPSQPVTQDFVDSVFHQDDLPPLLDAMKEGHSLENQADFEGRIVRPGGEVRHVLLRWKRNYDDQGNETSRLGTVQDVTERRQLQDAATRAQRLETAGRIAGQVAHDFNNLLGPLTAYPDLIRDLLGPGHPAQELMDSIESAALQMAAINQQLLTLGRRGHYEQTVVNLNEIVREAAAREIPRPKSLVVELELATDLMGIKGGGAQIARAVTNLLSNARDAMIDTGVLTLRTENLYVDDQRGHLERILKGEYVRLTIADTGAGMSAETMSKMFDPFFTTKTSDRRRGSGLGLSVTHAVMEDHRGYVDCESEVGRGTSMYLYFPVTHDHVSTSDSAEIVGGSEKVLIVDDDPIQRNVATRLLDRLGYRVRSVESGEQAVRLLQAETFDLLVLDMVMPGGIDGAETYQRILRGQEGQRAIIVSGYAESERVDLALRRGAHSFLKKPLTPTAFGQAVRRALDAQWTKGAFA